MKLKGKFLKSIIASAIAAVIAVGSAVCAIAADDYGSYEQGIRIPAGDSNGIYSVPILSENGFPNLDFEQGFKYWTTRRSSTGKQISKITDIAELKKDSKGNTYVHIEAPSSYYGLYSVRFLINELEEGSTPGLLYKWRGDQPYAQVYLEERYLIGSDGKYSNSLRVGNNGDRGATQIWPADEDDPEDWNIALSLNNKPVAAATATDATGKYPAMYYILGLEVTSEGNWIELDDIQIVIHNDTSGKVFDLQGNLLYDLTNLPKRQYIDYDWGDLSETVDTSEDVSQSSASVSGSDKVTQQAQKETGNNLYWIIIAAAVVIVAAAAVATVVIVRKKKAKASDEKPEEVTEGPSDTDTAEADSPEGE